MYKIKRQKTNGRTICKKYMHTVTTFKIKKPNIDVTRTGKET